MTQPTAADLADVSLFASMDPALLEKFAQRFEIDTVPEGRVITREGAAGYAFYVIRDGKLSVTQRGIEIGAMGPGDFFGEMSILGDGHRTATVTAEVESTLWVLFGTSFRELEIDAPAVAEVITEAVVQRLFQPE